MAVSNYPGYETTIVTRIDMPEAAHKKLVERLTSVVTSFDGEVVQSDDWGKRKLAYPISKQSRGRYTYLAYTSKPGVVQEIERNLRINDHVLRYLSIQVSQHFDKDEFLKNYQPISAEKSLEKGFREQKSFDYKNYDRERD